MSNLFPNANNELSINQFDEKRVAQRAPQISLNGSLPLSDLRDSQQTTGTGSITDNDSEFRIRHQAAGDFARLASQERGDYNPGFSMEAGVGTRLTTNSLTGDAEAIWGYFDMGVSNTETINDGFIFGLDSTGLFVDVIRDEVSQLNRVYSTDFNLVPNHQVDLTDGNIFQIDFTYYGYGLILFQQVIIDAETGNQNLLNLHAVHITGSTSAKNPNLQVGAITRSTSSNDDFSVFVGGRQVSIVGSGKTRARPAFGRVEGKSIGSTFEPVMTFRKKSAFREVSSRFTGLSAFTDTTLIVQVRVNADITGGTAPVFGDLDEQDASETSLSLDKTADTVDTSTGIKIYEDILEGGKGSKAQAGSSVLGIPSTTPDEGDITIVAKTLSGTATATIIGVLEENL